MALSSEPNRPFLRMPTEPIGTPSMTMSARRQVNGLVVSPRNTFPASRDSFRRASQSAAGSEIEIPMTRVSSRIRPSVRPVGSAAATAAIHRAHAAPPKRRATTGNAAAEKGVEGMADPRRETGRLRKRASVRDHLEESNGGVMVNRTAAGVGLLATDQRVGTPAGTQPSPLLHEHHIGPLSRVECQPDDDLRDL